MGLAYKGALTLPKGGMKIKKINLSSEILFIDFDTLTDKANGIPITNNGVTLSTNNGSTVGVFDSGTDYILMDSPLLENMNDNFTYEFSVISSYTSEAMILFFSGPFVMTTHDNGNLYLEMVFGDAADTANYEYGYINIPRTELLDNTSHIIKITKVGTVYSLYLDDVLKGSFDSSTEGVTQSLRTYSKVAIGTNITPSTGVVDFTRRPAGFRGYVDYFKVY